MRSFYFIITYDTTFASTAWRITGVASEHSLDLLWAWQDRTGLSRESL